MARANKTYINFDFNIRGKLSFIRFKFFEINKNSATKGYNNSCLII